MKKVIEEQIQLTDELKNLLPKIDFTDTFSTTNHFNTIEEISNLIFNTAPKWIELLFEIRLKMSKTLGLKTEIPKDYNEDFKVGGYVKFFKIFNLSLEEVVLGLDDAHLNFRIIILNNHSTSNNIKVITLVKYNNVKGKIYMTLIKPFHRIVVKQMVKNAYRK